MTGGQGYFFSCLLMHGFYRSLSLFFFFKEVSGAFGGPSSVGKIESNKTQGESSGWGHRQTGSAHWPTGKPQSHLLLGFSVRDAQPGYWVHVEPKVQGPP